MPGGSQHVVRRLGDEAALAGDERRADAAGRAADGGGDALRQRIAGRHRRPRATQSAKAGVDRRVERRHAPEDGADRADPR